MTVMTWDLSFFELAILICTLYINVHVTCTYMIYVQIAQKYAVETTT